MSIILKGIDMPKCSNEDIMVVIRRDKAEVWQTGYKERTVEAIQIPTPHGRLIDASTKTTVESMSGTAMDVGMLLIALKQYAPTILEAEE